MTAEGREEVRWRRAPANQVGETVRRIVDDIDGPVRGLLGRLGVVAQVSEAAGRP
jgi:hypothetical protein